ncbi:MAG: 4Fe-4S dicluster domain-containing protein [Firmicutes bacterium]|nr:4Fe-4S dicluster domain-containing protein [Bacillota bacterium]
MKHKYLSNVSTLEYNTERCRSCGRCTEVCPHGVFAIEEKKAIVIAKDSCMECGACALNCPAGAIEVKAGVGCAYAIILSWFSGKEPTCGCADEDNDVCCG